MNAYIFPGQGAQFSGMGKDLYESSEKAKALFEQANEILGFRITDTMFGGTDEELKQTQITQPAIFLHSVILAKISENFNPNMVAGHSLGEFSALVAAKALSFEDGLKLVAKRAFAMQKACEASPSTMAAVLGLEDAMVEKICAEVSDESGEVVVAANYNCQGQLVISGSFKGVELAGGAFHSPLMKSAEMELAEAIKNTQFEAPICPIYQNVSAKPFANPDQIMANLIAQLTAPVRWTQSVQNMVTGGATHFIESGPGKVLQGLVKKIHKEADVSSI